MTVELEPFEGRDVVATSIILTKTGDGLSQAMKIAPLVLHHGQVVDLVVRASVVKIRHDPDTDKERDDPDGLVRVQILAASALTVVENATVSKIIGAHLKAVAAAKELAGQQSLIDDNGDGPEDPE
jgi:mannose/fructose/N-acetylgalactosamine-specific phosphotransferase system component IIC